MKRNGDSTQLCWNPTTTVNGCDIALLKQTQTSWQAYNDLTASNNQPSIRRAARGGNGATASPFTKVASKIFRLIKPLMHQRKRYFNANQRTGPALGGLEPPRTWTLGPPIYNILLLTHSIYVNKNIDYFNKCLWKHFLQHQHNV